MRWRFADKAFFFAAWESIGILKAGSLEEYRLLERWGEDGLAPASLLLETGVQAARWLVEASSAFTVSCDLWEIASWRCLEGLRPGERFCVFLRVAERHDNVLRFTACQKRLLPGKTVPVADFWRDAEVEATFTVTLSPLAERYLPADRESLWREMLS